MTCIQSSHSFWEGSCMRVPRWTQQPCLTCCKSNNSNCFTPDESDTQYDLEAIKSDEVVLISQTAIIADEWLSLGQARSRRWEAMRRRVFIYVVAYSSQKAVCGTPVCARMRSVALVRVCKALPVRREMGWGRWMGGRFTLLLSLCSLPVCLNLPTTTHPLITCYCLLPPSLTVYFSSLHLATPPPSLQLFIYPSIIHNCITFTKLSLTFPSSHPLFYYPIKSCLSLHP